MALAHLCLELSGGYLVKLGSDFNTCSMTNLIDDRLPEMIATILRLRTDTLAAGDKFMYYSDLLPPSQVFYEHPNGRFTIEGLAFNAAGDYDTVYIREATAEEIALLKAENEL